MNHANATCKIAASIFFCLFLLKRPEDLENIITYENREILNTQEGD